MLIKHTNRLMKMDARLIDHRLYYEGRQIHSCWYAHRHMYYLPVSLMVFFDRKGRRGRVREGRGVSI